jgi:hypothetical protein
MILKSDFKKRDGCHETEEGMSVKWHKDTFLEPKSTEQRRYE